MQVSQTIIHQIEKQQNILEAHLTLSDNLQLINNRTTKLIEQLNNSFSKESKIIRTEFKELDKHYFKTDLDNFLKISSNDGFIRFSNSTLYHLRATLQILPFAKGGYYVYSIYNNMGRKYLGIFIIRDTEKLLFKRNPEDNGFQIDETKVVDTEKLAMACRIDIDKYNNGQQRYLQFTNYSQKEVSEYFINWIEANLVDKSREDTETLMRIINDVEIPKNPDTGKPYNEDQFRECIFDQIESSGKVVRLRELGLLFWENENFLLEYIEENNIDIDSEFRATPSILKNLKKYNIQSGNIKLSFKQSDLNGRYIRKGEAKNTIIIESLGLRRLIDEMVEDGNDQ